MFPRPSEVGGSPESASTVEPPRSSATARGYRASLLDYCGDPQHSAQAVRHVEDGLVVVDHGRIVARGDAVALRPSYPNLPISDYRGRLIVPGLIDTHVHYPQTPIIASAGEHLLAWLERYAFPAEARLVDPAHAEGVANQFVTELLSHGTTTAQVLCTVFPHSVDALARVAQRFRLRMIVGKVSMDRNVPAVLRDDVARTYEESRALIERWHGRGRLLYALTPRFAASCSEAQLAALGELHRQNPTTYVQSHLAETQEEVAWARSLFSGRSSYTDIYDHYGLVTERSSFAHGIYLADEELACLRDRRAAIAFCPTSNLFLGSGLFSLQRARAAGVQVSLATDVGAGTSFSLLRTMAEAYKVLRLQSEPFGVHTALYLATRAAAQSLRLEHAIGSLEPGSEADLCVLDLEATPALARRGAYASSLEEKLFSAMVLGDERVIEATIVAGEPVHTRRS